MSDEAGDRRTAQAAAFDAIGDRYDEAFPHKEAQVDATARLVAALPPAARVLDVGCGTGLPTTRALTDAGAAVTGIDISPGMVELARRNVPDGDFRVLDVLDLDVPPATYDAVVSFFALLMLPRTGVRAALARLHDALVPGGTLLLGMVEADVDDAPVTFLGATVRVTGYPRDELAAVVTAAGFEVTSLDVRTYAPAVPDAPPEVQLVLTCRRTP